LIISACKKYFSHACYTRSMHCQLLNCAGDILNKMKTPWTKTIRKKIINNSQKIFADFFYIKITDLNQLSTNGSKHLII